MIIDFRLAHQLASSEIFQQWLASEGLNYTTFRKKIVCDFKIEKLKARVTQPNVEEYFIERKIYLDRVVLSRLVVEERSLAEELQSQIIEDSAKFEQLVREYSVATDRISNGMMGPVSRGAMPDTVRALVDLANPGESIGPLEIDGFWYLFRVENFLPAALDEQMRQELEDELFERWLEDKVKSIDAKLQVDF
jgi:parvulin-like peptidyl-prolyl isomerase